jgi:DNA-binding Xre family transcriptional regulator
MKYILKNIEAIRKEKGIKQTVIAEQLGIKQNSYSSYITRNEDIKFSLLSRIADKLEVSVVDIITYPEKYVPASVEENRKTTRLNIELDLTNDDFLKMGLKDKICKILNK